MTKDLWNRLLIIAGVLIACIFFAFPLEKKINLGLDLKGGMHVVLQVDVDKLEEAQRDDAILNTMEILRNRIDALGGGEIVIQRQGDSQILVQLPGVTDDESARAMFTRVAHLQFQLVSDDNTKLQQAKQGDVPKGYELKEIDRGATGVEEVLLEERVIMKGDAVSDARVDFDQTTGFQPKIALSFSGKGTREFSRITQENIGRQLAIVLDGKVMSAPRINEPILTGNAEITGQFEFEEANLLALALRSGSLPTTMSIAEERTVGPLLGQDSIDAGVQATVGGILFVLLFMIIYYQVGGFLASIALVLNIFLILGFMGFMGWAMPSSPMTLTLPGIAGIILTLGMAVDANVLIHERIREELDAARPLKAAINSGFGKAFSAIIDSNLTTLIAAFMLFQFGSGPIKGFAVTLSMGLLCSLFTALFVTKTFFHVLIATGWMKKLSMLRLFKEPKFDFIKGRYICFALSAIMLVAGVWEVAQKGEAAYGIDFVGGQIQEFRFDAPVETERLRTVLKEAAIEDAVIQKFDQYPNNAIVRIPNEEYLPIEPVLKSEYGEEAVDVLRIENVGPVVGKALRGAAMWAFLLALLGIMGFVAFRFRHVDFAIAGIIALLHDVFVTLGLVVLMGRQIDLLVVTALLTIAGYSINDTIIIYDRVRENMKLRKGKMKFTDILNLSINQTLGRTILTTITTLLVVVTLFLKGGEVLNTFALCLMIGFVLGTYSTVFIASPLVLFWQKKEK